ncbi:hypothetical protein LB941_05740 [Ligilactobacillus sp. WILCCON 0076]|uniref:Uncharacterized protein n=1 Tax=Ligilactobacillus ubinensis TaxID=2876789 RepID=A0A9X2FK79_9LACO|nr:hypothetical protein [Ligilactobacillus ubinensis]MCP0886840.1 hypothetical protein [Ligilactobacillus ubinensis]
MRGNIFYIRMENVSHMVLSYGITIRDFMSALSFFPPNILLINKVDSTREIDINTGFNMILGAENVQAYLLSKQTKNQKWIDFDDIRDLEYITPREVSELLYLGHAYTNLQSPFYYKLQNNFIFLTLPNGALKVYYRRLDVFYSIFVQAVTKKILEVYRERKPILSLRLHVEPLEKKIGEQLAVLFAEGLVLDFSRLYIANKKIQLPLLIASDNTYNVKWHEPLLLTEHSKLVGNLVYIIEKRKWEIEMLKPQAFDGQTL